MRASRWSALFCSALVLFVALWSRDLAAQTAFGSVAIGDSSSATVQVSILTGGTLGSISVLTGGAAKLDFTAASGGTCTVGTSYSAGDTCTVDVSFSPKYSGSRAGAITLYDSSANPIEMGKAFLLGNGTGAQIAFFPPAKPNLNIPGQVDAFPGGIAVDASGDVFLYGGALGGGYKLIKMVPSNNGYTPVLVGNGDLGIALDSSGDVYVASGLTVERYVPLADGSYAQSTVTSGYARAVLVAVDAAGNVYVIDWPTNSSPQVLYKETRQADGSYVRSVISGNWATAYGIAVDAAQNVYVADHENGAIYKETLANGSYTQSTITDNAAYASGVAVDGVGNVFYSQDYDFAFQDNVAGTIVVPLLSDGTYGYLLGISVGDSPEAVALDPRGNLFVVDSYYLGAGEFDFADAPSLSFVKTLYETASSDSPKTTTVENLGNAPLEFSAITYPADFPTVDVGLPACSASTSLAPFSETDCVLPVSFKPVTPLNDQVSLTLNESVNFSTTNLSPTLVPEAIAVSGTEIAPVAATPHITPLSREFVGPLTITITDATPGATIHYTLDDSAPTASSTVYTGPITITKDTIILAIATAPGYAQSAINTQNYFILAPTPVISPKGGTYSTPQTVTITDSAAGATIVFTTDGTIPEITSTKYSGPFTVSSTETITARAYSGSEDGSDVTSAAYTILSAAATPIISPASGSYTMAQQVTISDTTPGAVVYYTTDGSTPTSSSKLYAGAITVSATETIKAIAVATGYGQSAVASATYTITGATATPVISPTGGTYTSAQSVTLSDATNGAVIYYTTNGATPTTSSTKYMGAIPVSGTETIEAIAVAAGYGQSAVASATYTIVLPAATPVISPAAGSYTAVQSVTITDATSGAMIYYTTNGTAPTTSSTKYTGAITVSSTETIEAIAVAAGYGQSAVASAAYTVLLPTATPVISPAGGNYGATQSVTIADATSGAVIYYTTDGSTPTVNSAVYGGAITVSATETIEAIAVAPGYGPSGVATAIYTLNLPPPAIAVTVSPSSLTITKGQSGTATITVTPENGFNAATTFSCTGLPSGATCSFAPATVTPSGGPATTTLTVATSATAAVTRVAGLLLPGAVLAAAVGCVGFRRRRAGWLSMLMLAVAGLGATLAVGCGGSSSSSKPVTASVSVVATSGSIQQTVPLSITIE
jgi:hypothetical protein